MYEGEGEMVEEVGMGGERETFKCGGKGLGNEMKRRKRGKGESA